MANSKFSYVRNFELSDALLPNTYLVVRLDGKGFHRFSDKHKFRKPNDRRALDLMNTAARLVMQNSEFGKSIFLAFGESDEYSFCFDKSCSVFNRREGKILSTTVSLFTSFYVRNWPLFFPNDPLDPEDDSPSFDGRVVVYPTWNEVIDYFKWRQVDTHINNLYNTCFWALVQQGNMTTAEAHAELKGTVSAQKNEILFSRFQINYSKIDELERRGSIYRREAREPTGQSDSKKKPKSPPMTVVLLHEDMLKDPFWSSSHFDAYR